MKRLPPEGRRMQQFGSGSALPSFTDLVNGVVDGRTSRDDITLYLNGGNQGLQFAAVGKGGLRQGARDGPRSRDADIHVPARHSRLG